jgi:hypothetical protein
MPAPKGGPVSPSSAPAGYAKVQADIAARDHEMVPVSEIQQVAGHVCEMMAAGSEPDAAELYVDDQLGPDGFDMSIGYDLVGAIWSDVCTAQ